MPARDLYHDAVRNALVKDGWVVTHDPLRLKWGKKGFFVDLGAEKLMAAEKEGTKIAVEIKTFGGASELEDLRNAVGQYIVYLDILEETEPERQLFLAVHLAAYREVFEDPIGQLLIGKKRVQIIVFDEQKEVIVQWVT